MLKYIIISDKTSGLIPEHPERIIVTPGDFVANRVNGINLRKAGTTKVINMCRNYDYLSKGYYCSLLAEARGLRCVPSVSNIIQLNWKRHYQESLPELNALLEKSYKEPPNEPLERTYYIYFGRTENPALETLARRLFDIFRFPLIAISLRYNNGHWVIDDLDSLSLSDIPKEKHEFFTASLERFTGATWSKPVANKRQKHWIGVLYDPMEKMPPSNKSALNRFIKAGKDMNLSVELITKNDYATVLEYDALFIRETTAINHHTFRFADKAEREGIPSMDDTQSIIRCCNKVFLFELLKANDVPVPETAIYDSQKREGAEQGGGVGYPVVLKIPDGSFSRGMKKADNPEQFGEAARELLKKSEIIIAQEFMPSDYDWRIGVLGGEPLYACKYFMAKGHWQIYQHPENGERGAVKPGDSVTMAVKDVPKEVLNVAVKACKLIGNGLYGVDLKQTERGVFVIEVNDNPNVDHGIEDLVLGDELYRRILEHLVRQIEAA
jgi:glutathione synthase/RimK-type ligase-like ATP-grasp enzyme